MNITDSVLTSIKKLLGIAEEYEHCLLYTSDAADEL